MPTPRGWACTAMAVTLLGVGRVLGVVELMVFGGVLVVLLLAAFGVVWLRPLPPMWLGRATRTPFVSVGETARIQLRVMNRGWRSCPTLLLRDHVDGGARRVNVWIAPLEPSERCVGAFRLPTRLRGRLRLGPVEALRVDPLGLVERVVVCGPDGVVIAHPTIADVDPLLMPWRSAAAAQRGRDGLEFHGLRSYVPGDDLRRVHWPTAARTGDLLVRMDAPQQRVRPVLVRVDTSLAAYPDPNDFELALCAAASYVRAIASPTGHPTPAVRLQLGNGPVLAGETASLEALAEAQLRPDDAEGELRSAPPQRTGRETPGVIAVIGPHRTPRWADGSELVVRAARRGSQESAVHREVRIAELNQLTSRRPS